MKLKTCALGALLLSCAGVALALEPATAVTTEWQSHTGLIDEVRQIQRFDGAGWRRAAPGAGYGVPERKRVRKPAHRWPYGRELLDVEVPAGLDLDLPTYIGNPVRDPEDDVVRCMAIGCEK